MCIYFILVLVLRRSFVSSTAHFLLQMGLGEAKDK